MMSSSAVDDIRGSIIGCHDREMLPPKALVLDRVMEGQPLASQSRLLRLPSDILTDIVNLLIGDRLTLASLALVNSDCRQLARSGQFADINFDQMLSRSQQLLSKLDQEHISRMNNSKPGLTIGACVRRIETTSYSQFRHRFIGMKPFRTGTEYEEQARQDYESMRANLQRVICSALPNLEVIFWHDNYAMDTSFFKSIMQSPARHVWLSELPMGRQGVATFPEQHPIPSIWPLKSLVIFPFLEQLPLEPRREEMQSGLASGRVFEAIIRSYAPTLEYLTWLFGNHSINRQPVSPASNGSPITFPSLRFLRLGDLGPPQSILPSLFNAPLRHLSIHLRPDYELRDILANCDTLRDLETLIMSPLPQCREYAEFIAGFIKRHEHVTKLHVAEDAQARGETAHLDTCIILPLFSTGTFERLRTLSLSWGGCDTRTRERCTVPVSQASLAAIARLTSLEELRLAGGARGSPRCQWLEDHAELRAIFSQLKKLRILSLQSDTYPWDELSTEDSRRYYVAQSFTEDEMSDVTARPDLEENPGDLARVINGGGGRFGKGHILMELLHRNRMLKLTEVWAAEFPCLKWTYFGERFIGIEVDRENPSRKKAVPLTRNRAEPSQFLEDVFTIAGFEK
ncbi:uncharacterized protein F4812DRAFT_416618 [Daldinia caldariorum]|uniref:uncharacterized protein n=1 Tax=Daldinia caldariorum TaxID=326644 RepID=UPI0020080F35|nr:uncharacterized protein F4812DRAFT_416618 [Daldinia caldariorum]KAI1472110.1 hypothetical protein F4812DRAFT_416618 [Daldinia caldariorum]